MADLDQVKESKQFYADVPQKTEGFFLKGSNAYDWGMKNRLARIFNPEVGKHRDAGLRPRLLPGADHGARARGPEHQSPGSPMRIR